MARAHGSARRAVSALTIVGLLAGCAINVRNTSDAEVVLPLSQAWMDGKRVDYVTTDVSDLATARMLGVNYVPRLADALPSPMGSNAAQRSLVERVYKFAGAEQWSVFQSAPSPTGPGNADRNYSPLWRMVQVHWTNAAARRELTAEEAILAAQDRGDLTLTVTDVVLNCAVVRSVDRKALQGVR